MPVILAEEWHTAEVLIHLYDQLEAMAAKGLVFTGTTGEEYTLGG